MAAPADEALPPLEEKIDLTLPEGPEGEEEVPLGDETLVAGTNAPAFDLSGIDLDLDKNPDDTLVLPELGADLTQAPTPEAEALAPAPEAGAPGASGPGTGAGGGGEAAMLDEEHTHGGQCTGFSGRRRAPTRREISGKLGARL